MIGHRLSTVRNADLILVMSDGRLVEQGLHDELIRLDGLYATLYNRQMRDTKKDPKTLSSRPVMASTPAFGG